MNPASAADGLHEIERQVAALVRAVVQASGPWSASAAAQEQHAGVTGGEHLTPAQASALVARLSGDLAERLAGLTLHAGLAAQGSPWNPLQRQRLQQAAATVATCQLAIARQLEHCSQALAVLLPRADKRAVAHTYSHLGARG